MAPASENRVTPGKVLWLAAAVHVAWRSPVGNDWRSTADRQHLSLDVAVAHPHALRLGYRSHHLSNVYSAPENPGVDGNVFDLGWTFRYHASR